SQPQDPDLVVFLQATSPLRSPADIQACIETLIRERADSLFSGVLWAGFTWRHSATSLAPVNYDPTHRPLRQELTEQIIHENDSIYVFKPWVLRQFNSRLGGQIAVHMMDQLNSFELDEPGDVILLEHMLHLRRPAREATQLGQIGLLVLDFDGVMTDNRVL